MEGIVEALENATLRDFLDDGARDAQLEETAAVEVAVWAGVVIMCMIMSFRVSVRCRNGPPRPPHSPPVKSEIECGPPTAAVFDRPPSPGRQCRYVMI